MTYNDYTRLLRDKKVIVGENSEGENVILQRLSKDCVCTITSQNNGWLRKNYYYEDGTTEETYER